LILVKCSITIEIFWFTKLHHVNKQWYKDLDLGGAGFENIREQQHLKTATQLTVNGLSISKKSQGDHNFDPHRIQGIKANKENIKSQRKAASQTSFFYSL